MNLRIKHRWWIYALPTAGSLLLLLDLAAPHQHARAHSRPTPAPVTRPDAARAGGHHGPAPRLHPRTPAAAHERAPSTAQQSAIDHLSDLDRTPEEDRLLWLAEEEIVRACMQERGVTYQPNPTEDKPGPDTEHPRARMGDVERRGFLEALRGPAISPADPRVRNQVESVALPGGGAAYWYRDSCLAQARHQLYGTDYEHNELGYSQAMLRNELRASADRDADYKDRLGAWHGCMLARGFAEERPAAAADRLMREYREGKLSAAQLHAQEVSIATADAECDQQSDIEPARRAAEAQAEQLLLAQNGEQVMAMKRSRDEALERAKSLLATHDL